MADATTDIATAPYREANPRGRDTIRTEANRLRVIKATQEGMTRAMAAADIGAAPQSLANWLTEDKEFRERLARADEEAAIHHYRELVRKGNDARDWRANAWILERRKPDDWGKRDTLNVEHSGTVRHELAAVDPALLPAALALLRGAVDESETVDAEEWITLAEASEEGE